MASASARPTSAISGSVKIAEAIIETLQSARQNVLIQRFIAESKGRDVRALVVGDRVVAAMRRKAQGDEFRSNVHRGGTTEAMQIPKRSRRAVARAGMVSARCPPLTRRQRAGPIILQDGEPPVLEVAGQRVDPGDIVVGDRDDTAEPVV